MEEVKQILVVDDYFQMLEFLRSVLEFSHHEYQVLAVPSAEEGVLELRRTAFDLVITDVRLPGMSGFDMVRQVKALNPKIPVIMITAYSSEQGRKEAEELGVKRYFKKPLDPDELLAAVHAILYGTDEKEPESEPEPVEVALSADVRRRLETLRSDTGARHVMLSSATGQVLYNGGIGQELDLPTLAKSIAESMQTSFTLAKQLKSPEPFTIQYQSGKVYDLYFANVREDYFVSIFFDAQARRGRLGTIWVFAQRAINDLRGVLATEEMVVDTNVDASVETASEPIIETADMQPDTPIVPDTAEIEELEPTIAKVMEKAVAVESSPAAEEEPAVEEVDLEITQEIEPPSLEDIRKFLGLEEAPESEDVDLDSFWDDALEETEESKLNSSGMSWEEARKQGLIPTELEQPKSTEE